MRRSVAFICVLACPSITWAQESDTTRVTTITTSGTDLLSELWNFEDATPQEVGTLQLRLSGRWATGQGLGDSSDEWTMSPGIVWGVAENFELSFTNNIWLGDGGNRGPFEDGNYDTDLGMLWRLHEQVGFDRKEGYWHMPSIALSSTFRIPTGEGSSGVDAELRLITTYEYESGVRSHFNVYGKSVNGDNFDLDNLDQDNLGDLGKDSLNALFGGGGRDSLEPRDFQYGAIIGADGPLCDESEVRWVADYMYRTSAFNGFSFEHIGEVGLEWEMSDMSTMGLSIQASLDHNDSQHQWAAGFSYAITLGT